MKIIKSDSGMFWNVVYNDIVIGAFYSKSEAQKFVDDIGDDLHKAISKGLFGEDND
jgi:hypothetical protein